MGISTGKNYPELSGSAPLSGAASTAAAGIVRTRCVRSLQTARNFSPPDVYVDDLVLHTTGGSAIVFGNLGFYPTLLANLLNK